MLYIIATVLFIIISILLCTVILFQESKSFGMGIGFGGSSETSMFGSSTADVLKKITQWLIITFVTICIFLTAWSASINKPNENVPFGNETTKTEE